MRIERELEQKRDRLARVVSQREALVGRIGTGQVKIGSSWENTLRVGHVRAKVRASATRLRGTLTQVEQEINIFGQARGYLEELTLRTTQLAEMSELTAGGNLPKDVLERYHQEYTTLTAQPDANPTLKKAVEKLRATEIPPAPIVTPDEGRRGSERFRLPNGREIGGKPGQLLRLAAEASLENLLSTERILEDLYPDVKDQKVAAGRLKNVINDARKALKGTNLNLKNSLPPAGQRTPGQKGGYYLETQAEQPEQHITVNPAAPETPEYGLLSRADVAIIAAALQLHGGRLNPFLEKRGIKPLEDTVLNELINLVGDEPIARLSSMDQKEMNRVLNDCRVRAFEKVKEMLSNPDFPIISDSIFKQNPNIWALLINLSELSQVIRESRQNEEGISFIEALLAAPVRAFIVTDAKTGFVTAVKFREPEAKELAKAEPTVIAIPAPTPQVHNNGAHIEKPVVAPEAASSATVSAEAKSEEVRLPDLAKATDVVPAEVVPAEVTPVIPKPEPVKLILKGVEARDPNIRAAINEYLDQVSKHQELTKDASPGMVTRAFPRLKETTITAFVGSGYVPACQAKKGSHNRFDPIAIAAMLYLLDQGGALPPRLKKQVQNIAAEEYGKRQAKEEKE